MGIGDPTGRSSGLTRWGLSLALLATFLLAALPLRHFPSLTLLDVNNHFSRFDVLSRPSSYTYYLTDWRGQSNELGSDLLFLMLRSMAGVAAAKFLVLSLALFLPVIGAVALNCRLFGRPVASILIFPAFAWTVTGLAGFLNFQLGLGLALITSTLGLLAQGIMIRAVVLFVGGVFIFLDHGLGFLFFLALQAALALGPGERRSAGKGETPKARRVLISLLPCLAAAAAVILATHTLPGDHDATRKSTGFLWNTPQSTAMAMLSPLLSYNILIDLAFAVVLAIGVGLVVHEGRISAHPGLVGVACALLVINLILPRQTELGGWLDRRLPLMALLLALSGSRFVVLPRPTQAAIGLAAIAFVAARAIWIDYNWTAGEKLYDASRSTLAYMRPKARLLSVQVAPSRAEIRAVPAGRFIYRDESMYRHLPALAVGLRDAFVPTLFTQVGVHPLRVKAAWQSLANPEGGDLPSIEALRAAPSLPEGQAYMRQWRRDFDYVLVLNADWLSRSSATLPAELKLVHDGGFARLYSTGAPPLDLR